ncbi:profilin family protein [Streptomyces sp. NPDC127069]|uniref:profilin family protein n=1 Tax=Streptomyces sp. NPDC127069 TaxID=3347128 RepID=UPI003666DECB
MSQAGSWDANLEETRASETYKDYFDAIAVASGDGVLYGSSDRVVLEPDQATAKEIADDVRSGSFTTPSVVINDLKFMKVRVDTGGLIARCRDKMLFAASTADAIVFAVSKDVGVDMEKTAEAVMGFSKLVEYYRSAGY